MIQVEWGNPAENVVLWTFTAPWTFDEFRMAQRNMHKMIDTVDGYVDAIYITSADQFLPLRAVTHLRSIIANRHKRLRYAVIVGAKMRIVTLFSSLTELVPGLDMHLRFARSQSEAVTMITKLRKQTSS